MVRNAASTPNLRETMAGQQPVAQLCGNDEYTKSLMNRVATGQASEAERLQFDEHVRQMPIPETKLPILPHLRFSSEARLDPAQQFAARDYEMQLRLLEDQNKKRYSSPQPVPLQDYHVQLQLLEAANQKRNALRDREAQLSAQAHGGRSDAPFGVYEPPVTFLKGHDGELPCSAFEPESSLPARSKGKKNGKQGKQKSRHHETPFLAGHDDVFDGNDMTVPTPEPFRWSQFSQPMPVFDDMSGLLIDEVGKRPKKSKAPRKTEIEEDERAPSLRVTREAASVYCKPFCDFMTDNPTAFHAVASQKKQLLDLGWTELDERKKWKIEAGGKYFVERNGSSMLAFSVGENYEPGNGCAIIAGHVDALTAKLKPVSEVPNKAGYLQLGVAQYAGALNNTWWDRDLGIGGRVLVKEGDKIVTKLVKLDWPIARIPTLAPHFGAWADGPFNRETQMVPIIGLEGTETSASAYQTAQSFSQPSLLGVGDHPVGNFVNTQPPALVKVVGDALGLTAATVGNIVNWELELFDFQPATVGGLNKEFIFAGRLDDKLCSWAAMQALISGQQWNDTKFSSVIKMVGWFDNEEIGSRLRQGAQSNFLPQTIERVVGCLSKSKKGASLMGRTYANSFLLSADNAHAVNPNFLGAYLENHAPHLNVGVAVAADASGNMTTDAVSTAILQRCADSVGAKLQVFQVRNDSRAGGTVGPMLSSMTGIRAIDAGIPQLSMHSIRATTGSLDPGLGVILFMGFLNRFEHIDKEFRD